METTILKALKRSLSGSAEGNNPSTDDYSLERVPDSDRKSWLDLSWNTAGIVTALVALYVGALVSFTVGLKMAVVAGLIVTLVGGTLGWAVGHIAYKTGLSSTVMARLHGFGTKGSIIASLIFGFMIIGFIAIENILLYHGFLFFFDLPDTMLNRVIIYSLLTLTWILLTAYGFEAVTRVSSIMLVSFLGVLIYMIFDIVGNSGQSWSLVFGFGEQFPEERLAALGLVSESDKLIFAINILIGSAGALALVVADLGRYAARSSGVGISAYIGNLFMHVIMLTAGGAIMFAGLPALVDYYVGTVGMTPAEAEDVALQNPESLASAFIVFGGAIGAFLMVVAQSKTQVLNTYSSSLSLTNLFDAILGWQPGRMAFVIGANLLSVLFIFVGVVSWLQSFLIILGVLTTCFSSIMVADYFVVRPYLKQTDTERYGADWVNWAGVLSIAMGFVFGQYILVDIIKLKFFTVLIVSFIVYPILRIYVFKPNYQVSASDELIRQEAV